MPQQSTIALLFNFSKQKSNNNNNNNNNKILAMDYVLNFFFYMMFNWFH